MARDIEEFLRRAAERRQQQKGGGKPKPALGPQPPRRQEPVVPEIVEIVEEQPRVQRPPLQQLRQQPPRKKPNLRQQSVSEHVQSNIDTSDIADHAESLGDRIVSVHDQIEATVHKHLDHDLTELDDNPTVTDNRPSQIFGKPTHEFSNELRAMLRDQKMVGKAIILAEILKRPEW